MFSPRVLAHWFFALSGCISSSAVWALTAPPGDLAGLPWPQIRESELQPVQSGLKTRADAVVGALLKENVESGLGRFALNSAWSVFGRRRVLDKAMDMVRDALAVAGLLAGIAPPPVPTGGPDRTLPPVRSPEAGAPGGKVGNG